MHDRNNGTDYYLSKLGTSYYKEVENVKCPFCRATPGNPCVNNSFSIKGDKFRTRGFPHVAREIKFEKSIR